MNKILLLFGLLAFFVNRNYAQNTITDIDGNVYNTVTIGTQVWMKENLKVTHYSNGVEMDDGTSAGDITGNYTTKYYFDYDNNTVNTFTYGKLYTWAAVMNGTASSNSNPSGVQGPCPTGWHVPSDAEWNIMEIFLDNTVDTTHAGWTGTDIGNKLKEANTNHWGNAGINTSNFTALPSGGRSSDGSFHNIYNSCYWWTSTSYYDTSFNELKAWTRYLGNNDAGIYRLWAVRENGFSLRCVKNSSASQINDNSIDNHIQIYPNPAMDMIFIDWANKNDFKMQVYNIIGECVLQGNLKSESNMIDISPLTSGIYMIRLTGTDRIILKKLIKN